MAPRKRPAEAIDLTNDDSPFNSSSQGYSSQGRHRASKQARSAINQRTASGSSQTDAIYVDDEEEDASQDAPDATQGYNEREYSYGPYGAMHTKIVGVRYYNGYATVGEMVMCRREPQNPYDRK